MQLWRNDTDSRKVQYSEESLSQCLSAHTHTHLDPRLRKIINLEIQPFLPKNWLQNKAEK